MPADRPDPQSREIPSGKHAGGTLSRLFRLLVSVVAIAEAAPRTPEWIDVRLEHVIPRRNVGIPNCDAMVSHQWELARVRDTMKRTTVQGKARKAECLALPDTADSHRCSDNLDSMRTEVRRLRGREKILQDSVRRHAGRCNAPAFKAWQDLQALRATQDTMTVDSSNPSGPFDKLVEAEFASVWSNQRQVREARLRTGRKSAYLESQALAEAVRFQERVKSYLSRQGGRNPSPMTHFLLAVVDHRAGRDDQALARLRKVPAKDSTSPWKAPIALLYGQILAPSTPDSAIPLLRSAMDDSELAPVAMYLLAEIELERHRPDAALEHLAAYLSLPLAAPSPGSRRQAIELAALSLIRIADKPSRVRQVMAQKMPPVASDSIALEVARTLIAENAYREGFEILTPFQVDYPGTRLADDARTLLGEAQRRRRGSLLSW